MSHRRASQNAKKKGVHGTEPMKQARPPGNVRPVVSSRKHGKPVEREVSDADGTVFIAVILILAVGSFVSLIIHILT